MSEMWLPAPGYEGLYSVSDLGRVRSEAHPEQVLRPALNGSGYLAVGLRRDGERRTRKVHRLVAHAFHGPLPTGMQTRHLDGDRENNAASNLAYGTRSENMKDAVHHGTHNEARKTHCPSGHLYDEANTYAYKQAHGGTGRACRACRRQEGNQP